MSPTTQPRKPLATPELEELARQKVGDGLKPELFFVSRQGVIILVSCDFGAAYDFWREQNREHRNEESALENRSHGVLASREPAEENSSQLITTDDSRQYYGRHFPR